MVNFVWPNLLGTRQEFSNRFINPITNGQHSDSTLRDVQLMKKRAHILHQMLSGCIQVTDFVLWHVEVASLKSPTKTMLFHGITSTSIYHLVGCWYLFFLLMTVYHICLHIGKPLPQKAQRD